MLSNFDQMNIENLILISNEIYFATLMDKGRVVKEDDLFMNDKCHVWFNDKFKQLEA